MSVAGIYSNRGDYYQALIALEWALSVLESSEYQWLEIDSIEFKVDDIVIGKTDGSFICCQCKKNQTDFKAWSLTDLSDELNKAFSLLGNHENVFIQFYSRDSFGELAKLKEHSRIYSDENSYYMSLPAKLQDTDAELSQKIVDHGLRISSYQFIKSIKFETTPDYGGIEAKLHERLRYMVSSSDTVYNALWNRLSKLSARSDNDASASTLHRLTKDDLRNVVLQAGGILARPIDSEAVKRSFAGISCIGRSWRRDIAGQCLPRSVLDELLSAISNRQKAILLTGLPGSGKTCVMLSLQEALERWAQADPSIIPLFIQSRIFADSATVEERSALGLPEYWIEEIARLAENGHVIVVVDSLDVLSIAREHSVLTYFLTQLDRLLGISNVTVVTACRDFDRHYDPRIAGRKWDCELKCDLLDWNTEVKPLLEAININPDFITSETRELIRTPRELALFAELTQRGDNCNAATSQALTQHYLDVVVTRNQFLGNNALQAIEELAEEMLKKKQLTIPRQRASISDDIKRRLCSHNIIQENQRGELTFGHQTLLDVLVVSGALRKGITLNKFIEDLSPVPFVRPCIRSFLEQLAAGNRQEYRKQLRTVLTGNKAFHIRRLVAESFAEQNPLDEDWSLIRDLRNNHREVFQVIYGRARKIGWFHFWNKYLVPILFDLKDVGGLNAHLFRTSLWKNKDIEGVLAFWSKLLELDYMDPDQLVWRLSSLLEEIDDEYLKEAAPLLERLLNLPSSEHRLLGHAIARYVSAGALDDIKLWQYIAGDISNEDIKKHKFDNKLHCQSYEFGDNTKYFLQERILESVVLLDLAINAIEKWSQIESSRYGMADAKYHDNFLDMTSYEDKHSKFDHSHDRRSERILFDAIEKAIIKHAKIQSEWWQINSRRICFNHERALRYWGILACMSNPQSNVGVIGDLLTDRMLLESRLSYELGLLIRSGFIYLDSNLQETVMQVILSIYQDRSSDKGQDQWVLREQSELISFIPCFLRSPKAQSILDDYERVNGKLVPMPAIYRSGGMVRPPFSFDKFLYSCDDTVLLLIKHYFGYVRDPSDFLEGGEEEVRRQLYEASSRQPARFLNMLSTNWDNIPCRFRDNIMEGIAAYFAHRYANSHTNDSWEPLETPEGSTLASQVIDELEQHSIYWHHNRAASSAIEDCAHVINDTLNATRLISLCLDYCDYQEEDTDESKDLIQVGINMTSGHIVEAIMILANNLLDNNIDFPDLLPPTLLQFVQSEHKAHQALILRRLPYFQSKNYNLGWSVFEEAMKEPAGLWEHAEMCLHYAYKKHYDKVEPLLNQIYDEANGKDLEIWGRISALASFSNHIEQTTFLNNLKIKNSPDAWKGAVQVWTHPVNIKLHKIQCLIGIEASLKEATHASVVAQEMTDLFCEDNATVFIPVELIQLCFNALENKQNDNNRQLFGIPEWLKTISLYDPEYALTVTEIYLNYVTKLSLRLDDFHNNFTQLITRLFAEAEEREEIDDGAMLQRVVSLQDTLLARGVSEIDKWLKAAERP